MRSCLLRIKSRLPYTRAISQSVSREGKQMSGARHEVEEKNTQQTSRRPSSTRAHHIGSIWHTYTRGSSSRPQQGTIPKEKGQCGEWAHTRSHPFGVVASCFWTGFFFFFLVETCRFFCAGLKRSVFFSRCICCGVYVNFSARLNSLWCAV